MVKEFISQLPPDKLSPFAKHPYRVREDAAMDELVESVRTYGILSPLLARPKGEGYELVSGHRRRLAAQKLGLPTVPVLVREMTDDEAVILMVDSNLQRENLLPSEKAFAYKMKLEAMKRQAGRPKKNQSQVATKYDTASVIGHESGESRDTVFRYIRLTNLVPPLLQMVDDGRIAFSPAVELSYLTRDEQAELWDLIGREDATPSLSQALRMKQLSREAKLTPEVLYAILTEEKPNQKEQIRIKTESLRKYFPRNYSACAADGAGDHQAAGGPLPREGQGRAMIFVYWHYTNFFRTIAAERSEDYGAEFTAIAAGHF
jgi:ParB family chromosome partitioning protein